MLEPTSAQRDLRAPMPARTSTRMAASAEHLATVAAHLTSRDRWLARMLAEHRVLTSTQITQLAFPSRRAANLRLRRLHHWRITNRFQPYIGRGRAPMYYVLDTTGAHLLAHEDGLDPRELSFRTERSIGIAHSLRLAHLHGLNSLFTALIADAASHADQAVTAWWSESRCTRHFGDHARPDGYGRWYEAGREIEWFCEYDTGSYPLTRLVAKLPGYLALAATTGITTPLLICFAGPRRETHARRQLADHLATHSQAHTLPIATTTTEQLHHTGAPAGPAWLPLQHTDGQRHRLIQLLDAWPHLATTAPSTSSGSSETNLGAHLSPPAPMPPWSQHELSWIETR